MGGKAFLKSLPDGSLPRLPPQLYQVLKDRLKGLLRTLYTHVEAPPEAPGKKDHGDIDFVVALPIEGREDVTPTMVGHVIGAVQSVELDGNRTSNYALQMNQEDVLVIHGGSPGDKTFYFQVDVRVCMDEEELERVVVLHGYGDLGIMMTAIAKSHGLSLGTKGLKIVRPSPDPPMHLSGSPSAIFDFMGLSMARWKNGFATLEDIFVFASTSRLFDPRRFPAPQMRPLTKSVPDRPVYHDFLAWAQNIQPGADAESNAVGDALVCFGKKAEWDATLLGRSMQSWLKSNFNGNLVAEWTGLGWRGVKAVMDDVRASVGGESTLIGKSQEDVKDLVLASKASLGLQ